MQKSYQNCKRRVKSYRKSKRRQRHGAVDKKRKRAIFFAKRGKERGKDG